MSFPEEEGEERQHLSRELGGEGERITRGTYFSRCSLDFSLSLRDDRSYKIKRIESEGNDLSKLDILMTTNKG